MDNKAKAYKIPRAVLAQMTGNNPQAIKAFENMEASINYLPGDLEAALIQALDAAMQAAMMANQIKQDLAPYLQAVAVPVEQSTPLSVVAINIANQGYLSTIGGACDCPTTLQPI